MSDYTLDQINGAYTTLQKTGKYSNEQIWNKLYKTTGWTQNRWQNELSQRQLKAPKIDFNKQPSPPPSAPTITGQTPKQPWYTSPSEVVKTAGEAGKNLIPSVWNQSKNAVEGVVPLIKQLSDKDNAAKFLLSMPKGILSDLESRWGKDFRTTLEKDPASLLMDVATLAGGVEGGAKSIASMAGKIGMEGTADAAGMIGKGAAITGRLTNPFNYPGAALGTAAKVLPQSMIPLIDKSAIKTLQTAGRTEIKPYEIVRNVTPQEKLLTGMNDELNKIHVALNVPTTELASTIQDGLEKSEKYKRDFNRSLYSDVSKRAKGDLTLGVSVAKIDEAIKEAESVGKLADITDVKYLKALKEEFSKPMDYNTVDKKLNYLGTNKIAWKWADVEKLPDMPAKAANVRYKDIYKTIDKEIGDIYSSRDDQFKEAHTTADNYYKSRKYNDVIKQSISKFDRLMNGSDPDKALKAFIYPGMSEENTEMIMRAVGDIKNTKVDAQGAVKSYVVGKLIGDSTVDGVFDAQKLKNQLDSKVWGKTLSTILQKEDVDIFKGIQLDAQKAAQQFPKDKAQALNRTIRYSIHAFGPNTFISSPIGNAWLQKTGNAIMGARLYEMNKTKPSVSMELNY